MGQLKPPDNPRPASSTYAGTVFGVSVDPVSSDQADSTATKKPRVRTQHRPALITFVIVGAVICVLMGWWQWDRFQSSSGTGQNLGYALQWPAFAVCLIYCYRRFVRLESDPNEVKKLKQKEATNPAEGLIPARPSSATIDDSSDAKLHEYNQYLAELGGQESTNAGEHQT